MDNRGAKRLRELGLKQVDVASKVGAHQSMVCRWENGDRKPETPYRAKLEDEYGIGWRLWDEDLPEEKGDAA